MVTKWWFNSTSVVEDWCEGRYGSIPAD